MLTEVPLILWACQCPMQYRYQGGSCDKASNNWWI